MEETIGCKTVQQLETFLQEEYHAQPVEPVDYLLYNARQQMLNLFYPQQMQQLAEQIGFGPESDEEICALFDCLTEPSTGKQQAPGMCSTASHRPSQRAYKPFFM